MRIACRILSSLLLIVAFGPMSASAQRNMVPEILAEKIRLTPEQIRLLISGKGELPELQSTPSIPPSERESVVSGGSGVESEVHAAINPLDSNNLIVSPIQSNSTANYGLVCPIYYTRDFGRTWKKSTFKTLPKVTSPVVVGGGDPILGYDENGVAYVVWISIFYQSSDFQTLRWGLFWASSTDGGVTWKQADTNSIALSTFPASQQQLATVYDKEWLAIDRTTGPRRNTLYLAFVEQGHDRPIPTIVVRRKDPDAKSFTQQSVTVSTDDFKMVQFANVAVDPQGDVHVTFFGTRDSSQYAVWHSVSTDGGRTFSNPQKVSDLYSPRFSLGAEEETIPGILPTRYYPCPQLTADNSNGSTRGNLYVTWTSEGFTSKFGDGLDIYFARSTDGGKSWSTPIVANDDPRGLERNQYYSSVSVSPGGIVALTWYDRRDDPDQLGTDYYMSYSFDGGRTFSKSFPVSSQPTNASTIGDLNNGFGVGEYTQVLTTRGYAVPVWSDGRNGDGDLNIFSAFVPLTSGAAGVGRVSSVSEQFSLESVVAERNQLRVAYRLNAASTMKIQLFDPSGRMVATLVEGHREPASGEATMDISRIASGIYFCRMETAYGVASRQVTIIR